MTATATIPARNHRTTLGWAGLALGTAAAAIAFAALIGDDASNAPRDLVSTHERAAVSMSADAAERWMVDSAAIRGMTPDAAERWLTGR